MIDHDTARFDLDRDSREALEFDEIVAWVTEFARSRPGRRALEGQEPSRDAERVRALQDGWSEMAVRLDADGALLGGALPDPAPALQRIRGGQEVLDPVDLRELALFLQAVDDAGRRLRSIDPERFPILAAKGAELPRWQSETEPVLRGVDPEGAVRDEASPELARIRRSRVRLGESLRSRLEALVRDPEAGAVIRDDFVTERNGRYVIPVRSDSPRPVRGIVHATSSSGATRFVEPLETLEMNNELIRLTEDERHEIERILRRWTGAFARRLEEALASEDRLGELDAIQARALFARDCGGVAPSIEPGGAIELVGVRHALLDRRLRAAGDGCRPLDLRLDPADRVLVLSGPNAGGKTVALKALGLTILSAQAGLPVAARRATLPLYRQLRADIGDHQSIDQDLSTFSGHVRSIATALRDVEPPALLLFDEIGGGTDPAEGGALAQAILEAARGVGRTVVATTHLGAVKAWAVTTDGVASAAMEFDTESMRPTFRILEGVAGGSAGLAIARRYGLPDAVIERARQALGPDNRRSEEYLDRLRRRIGELESKIEALAEAEARLARERERVREEAAKKEEERGRRVRDELDRAVEEIRRSGRRELARVREARERRKVERELARVEEAARRGQARAEAALAAEAGPPSDAWRPADRVRSGQRVWVRSLGREGVVGEVRDRQVDVLLGRMPFRVDLGDLWVGPSAESPAKVSEGRVTRFVRGETALPGELLLLGRTVDEALVEVDRYLDDAARAEAPEVRIVHGHGTGRLRRAVREHLRGHARVAEQRPGQPHEGGDGATVVRLR